jgi:hypothetical protein
MLDIVDKYLNYWVEAGLNKLPGKIELEMSDPNQDKNEEWRIWFPISSRVIESEFPELENKIGYKLPDSYKRFLRHKHFYELNIDECSFCSHPGNSWQSQLTDFIFDGYPTEYHIDKGRVPFANWSDWGLLCFDTTVESPNHEYPIVLWDHDRFDDFEYKYPNFETMIIELDKESIKNHS